MFLIVISWTAYFTIHSLLASNQIKSTIYKMLPSSEKYYRIIYNIISIITLIPISFITYNWIAANNTSYKLIIFIIGLIILLIGVLLLIISFSSFNIKEFIGLEQYQQKEEETKLVVSGMYQYVRHPLYFSIIIIFIGILFIFPNTNTLILNIIINLYLIIGSRLEEQKLISYFGEEYKEYKKKVKGLIPFLY